MAQRTTIHLVDDMDGKEIKAGNGDTVRFALDGTSYEIDLSRKNAATFRGLFDDYVAAGRRVSGGGGARRRSAPRTPGRDHDPKAVRKWAASNKVKVPARGRIPHSVLERFKAAGN